MASGEERARVAQALYYCASASCALLVYDPTDFKRKTIGPRDAGEELKRERYVCWVQAQALFVARKTEASEGSEQHLADFLGAPCGREVSS